MAPAPAYNNNVRIGYARVSARRPFLRPGLTRSPAERGLREIIVETASTRGGARPGCGRALAPPKTATR